MGCAPSREPLSPEPRPLPADRTILTRASCSEESYAAFLSHYKVESATEARWLQGQLEPKLCGRAFLDSDDLRDLGMLKQHVRDSKCLVLLQTKSVLQRPWCILEMMTAITERIPIVGISITSGTSPYDFAQAHTLMTHFDTLLP